jgi:hypothetical protein
LGGTIAITLFSIEAGFRLGKRHSGLGEVKSATEAVVPVILGLLAFMVSFTFSAAATRFSTNRRLEVDEANAIGTAYLRAQLLPEPGRGEVSAILRRYADVRVKAGQRENLENMIAESEELHLRLWDSVGKAAQLRADPLAAVMVEATNQLIDLHSTRVFWGMRTNIPDSIWGALYFLLVIGMAGAGYSVGLTGIRCLFQEAALAVAFSLVFVLVADLDRPYTGMVKIGQQDIASVQKMMAEHASGK